MRQAFVCLMLLACPLLQAQSNPGTSCPNSSFNPKPWLDDFNQLTAEMSAHYSNLEFAVQLRHMDLPSLRRDTEARLARSCDDREARHVLESFLNSFGDGHLELDGPPSSVRRAMLDGSCRQTETPFCDGAPR
jgi:hypothetical protein